MKKKVIFLYLAFLFLISLGIVISVHTSLPKNVGANHSQVYSFNITLNNTGGQLLNITQINITLPPGIDFIPGTNETNTLYESFVNSTNVAGLTNLSWANITKGYLINGSVNGSSFLFNATINTSIVLSHIAYAGGQYNITIWSQSGTTYTLTNLSVNVSDVMAPYNFYFYSYTPDDSDNLSQDFIPVNVTALDNIGVSEFIIYLHNSTKLVNSTNLTVSGTNVSAFINYTSLPDEFYYLNVTVNDSSNNNNLSLNMNVTLDTTAPVSQLSSPANGTETATSPYNFYVNLTDNLGLANITLYLWNATSASAAIITNTTIISGATNTSNLSVNFPSAGTYTWNYLVTDSANNLVFNSTNYTIIVTSTAGTYTGVSGGGGSLTWSTTFVLTENQFKEGIKKSLRAKQRIKVEVVSGNTKQEHYVGVKEVTAVAVTLLIESNPIEVTMKYQDSEKFDLTEDGYYDINIKIYELSSTSVGLWVKSIHEKVPEEKKSVVEKVTETVKETVETAKENSTWIIILIVLIILIIAAIVYYKKYYKIKQKEYNNK